MSAPSFRTFHALRIKGFASVETVAEIAEVSVDEAHGYLGELLSRDLAVFNEARRLWRLTPAGRDLHSVELASDAHSFGGADCLANDYRTFLLLNERFKQACGDWQLRDGQPNDHSDAAYDAAAVATLVAINAEAQPIVSSFGTAYPRFLQYSRRLDETCQKLVQGETKMFTGVMCGSYHDVWMELHEDLILTQGIDRSAEGSF